MSFSSESLMLFPHRPSAFPDLSIDIDKVESDADMLILLFGGASFSVVRILRQSSIIQCKQQAR